MGNPNYSHFLIAQIKTIEQFKSYPDVLIYNLEQEEKITEDEAKAKLYHTNINL